MKIKKHEPCMTLKDLARLKGISVAALSKRAKKIPYPAEVVFGETGIPDFQVRPFKRAAQYRRSELLAWFDATN